MRKGLEESEKNCLLNVTGVSKLDMQIQEAEPAILFNMGKASFLGIRCLFERNVERLSIMKLIAACK